MYSVTVFRQGDDGKAWYVIMQGAVSVETYSKGVVESLYDGEDFGGLALIHNVPRYFMNRDFYNIVTSSAIIIISLCVNTYDSFEIS